MAKLLLVAGALIVALGLLSVRSSSARSNGTAGLEISHTANPTDSVDIKTSSSAQETALGQGSEHLEHSSEKEGKLGDLPVAIDGATSPHLISDRLAYAHFVIAMSNAGHFGAEESERRDHVLDLVGLSAGDKAQFLRSVGSVKQSLDEIEAQRRFVGSSADALTLSGDLRAQRDQVLDSAALAISLTLSAEGRSKLDAFINERVKPRIVVYGTPPTDGY